MAIEVLDQYYLAITLLITVGYQLLFFSIAFSLKFDKLTDFAGGTNFILLSLLTLLLGLPDLSARSIVASSLLALWAARLSGFLLYRILKTGHDARFDDKRDRFFPFLGFWVAQMLWVWVVSLPVTVLNSPAVGGGKSEPWGSGRDIAGVVLFGLGFTLETEADLVRFRWRNTRDRTGSAFCDRESWKWSRHPNYFGEIILQFGKFILYW
jgi:steroid 5-alpha reductase family enzyme